MAREYQVKINVDSTKAEAALSKFEQKAQRTFDKLNKTSFQPTAFINGINVSIQKVMQLAVKEQEAAAKIAQANAKVEEAHKKVVESNNKLAEAEQKTAQAKEKTAQAEQKTAQETEKAQAKIAQSYNKALAEYHKVEQAQKKMQAEHIKGLAKVGAEEQKTLQIQEKVRADYIKGLEKQQQKAEETRLKEEKLNLEYEKMASKFIIEQGKMSSSAKQGSSEIISSHQAVANNFTKVTGQMSNAWNQLKMVIGFAGVTGVLRSAFNEMKAMSDELITYQKVTGASAEQVSKVRASAYQSAGRYGQTPSDFLASVAVMARAGYGEQSEAMADLATKTQLVGDMTSEAASKFLIAVDAGYQLKGNIDDLNNVLDKANIIDNNYATSLSKVADAMTLIAPLSASMNVSIEETMAAIGTMSAVTQREGTEVARAYRMIALNIAKDTETEVEEGVKLTEEEIKSLNDILQVYAKEELKAADAAGKLLSPMKAIEAIARAWKNGTLNEQELFKVLQGIGGARYTNSIMALVKNFDMYEDMLSKFVTEMGSADAEVEAMTKGWTAKFNQLKVAWTEMVNNAVSEDFIRQLLDISKGFLEWTGNLQTFIGVVGGASVALKYLKTIVSGSISPFNVFALAIGAVTSAIFALSAAENQRKQSAQDSAKASEENAQKAYEQAQRIDELTQAYKKLAADGMIDSTELSEAESIQKEINSLVGNLQGKYDLVNGSIEKNISALQRMNDKQREGAYIAAREAVYTAGNALVEYNKPSLGKSSGFDTSFATNKKISAKEDQFFKEALSGTSFAYFKGEGLRSIVYAGEMTAEAITTAYAELEDIINKATENALANLGSEGYYALIETRNAWTDIISNYKNALEYLDAIETGNYSKLKSGSSYSDAVDQTATDTTDDAVRTWDRLTHSIEQATNAKAEFDRLNETTKADEANAYASVYATLAEELANGKVNSTATHAALRMLLGAEAYDATGGNVQALQAAWTGKKAGQKLSAAESYEILTGTYTNQNGQTVEGAGIAVLAEKVGMEVRDELGNYMLDFTDSAKLEELSAMTGVTVDALRSALNAYDQYDIYGTNTGEGHPQEQDPQIVATEKSVTATETLVTAVEADTAATEANANAVNALTAALGGEPAGGTGGGGGGSASSPSAPFINGYQAFKKAESLFLEGMEEAEKGYDAIHNPAPSFSGEGMAARIERAYGMHFEEAKVEDEPLLTIKAIDGTEITLPDNDLNRQIAESLQSGGVTLGAINPIFGALGGKGAGSEADAKADAEEVKEAITEGAEAVKHIDDNVAATAEAEQGRTEALDYWGAMLQYHRTGSIEGYTGSEDIAGDYQDYLAMYGEGTEDELVHRANEAKIIAGVEPIIDKYSLQDQLLALESGLNKENIPVVIDTILNKHSLQEVLSSLNLVTDENRTAIINAAVSKYGKDAVIAELKKIASNDGGGWAAAIIAQLESSSKEQTKKELKQLTKSETKTIYTKLVTARGGPVGVEATAHEAVGTAFFHGGSALVNDGTGAELVVDSHGAHVYGGGRPTITNIESGAAIYTAEQTRQLINSVPHHATGADANAAAQLAAELNAFFDYIRTGDTSYTLAGSAGAGAAGSAANKKASADDQWDKLKELIEYIIKRLGKALEAQEKVIDEQIQALQAQKSQRDEQSKIEELQKAVAEAQSNLAEAQSQRSVRYIDDNGQWHWMADQKKVQEAQKALDEANKSFVDYLYEVSIDAQVKALEDEKTRLSDEYTGYKDLWSDILDAVATPTGDLVALIQYLTANGTGAQRNGANAVRSQLITAMLGGSYSANYNEALGEIGKAAANNPSVPGISDAALAALIASSGTSVSNSAMLGALQSIAGSNAAVGSVGGSVTSTDNSVQYYINGVQIGSNMASMPLSEVLQCLSVYANASR